MQLFLNSSVRRCAGLLALLFVALPFGLSVAGCGHKAAPAEYCSAGDTGPVVGQVAKIILAPNFATVGESLNYGQIGSSLSATAYDCKGNTVSVQHFVYASTSSFSEDASGGPIFADINPSTGQICGGTWNRNTGGGIANYTTCTPPSPLPAAGSSTMALATATANGTVSNAIPIFIHPVVTGIQLGDATTSSTTNGPGTDTCSNDTVGTPVVAPVYTGQGCISQQHVGQLVARVFANGKTDAADNITCQVGHIAYAAQTASVVTIDENGAATAQLPGSSVITATISNSSTATQAGFFSTCPPASITLAFPGSTSTTANVGINNTQPFTATVLDTNGNLITGLALEYVSTTPSTIPASVGTVTPAFPGSADITAVCLPSGCNPAPFSQIGLPLPPLDTNGNPVAGGFTGANGKAVTSNPLTVNAVGTSSTVIYMGSTQSQYVQAHDFTTNQPGTLIKLPFVPNSMVVNSTGTGIYLGSSEGLMSFATSNNLLGTVNQSVTGVVLSISPDNSTLVVTDPARQTISLVTTTGGVTAQYGGIATHAAWSSDAQTVYITTSTGTVLTHSSYTDWQTADPTEIYNDVVVAVPAIGAYFAGPKTTDGRSYCPLSTVIAGTGNSLTDTPPNMSNQFIPVAVNVAAQTDRLSATTDGKHILGAYAVSGTPGIVFNDIQVTYPATSTQPDGSGGCTTATSGTVSFNGVPYLATFAGVQPTTDPTLYTPSIFVNNQGVADLPITGVVSSSNSQASFVTYTGAGGLLPAYFPQSSGAGTTALIPLSGGAAAPISGVFSTDNFSFFTGTEGDNAVHIIGLTYPTTGTPTAVDTGNTITPNLPNVNGAASSPVNLIVQFPKKATS